MTKTIAVTEAFTSLKDVESKFNFSRTTDSQFFLEWYENLPELTSAEKESLDRVKNVRIQV